MSSDPLPAIARCLLELPPTLVGESAVTFLERRLERGDWIPADRVIVLELAGRLLEPRLQDGDPDEE